MKFAFPHLYHVEKGTSEGVWSADWRLKTGRGLHVRLTVASSEGMEVNVCDGKPPAGGSPYEMKWLMLHKQGNAPLKTQLVQVLEPYLGRPLIQEVRPLRLSGADESGFAAAGCIVRLADRTDTLLASADPAVEHVAASAGQAGAAKSDLSFAGRFGFCSERDGAPVSMVLVGGTKLAKGPFELHLGSAEYRAKIVQVDRATETVLLSSAPPVPHALVGNYVFITNPSRRIAYKVIEAKVVGDRAQLRLALDSRIGAGRVTDVEDYRVRTETPFPLNGFRYYHGARLVNAQRTAEYRLIDVRTEKAAFIDPQIHRDAKAGKLAKEFPKGAWFDVYDYGVGDEIVFPHQARLTRTGPNMYFVTATDRVERRRAGRLLLEAGRLAVSKRLPSPFGRGAGGEGATAARRDNSRPPDNMALTLSLSRPTFGRCPERGRETSTPPPIRAAARAWARQRTWRMPEPPAARPSGTAPLRAGRRPMRSAHRTWAARS